MLKNLFSFGRSKAATAPIERKSSIPIPGVFDLYNTGWSNLAAIPALYYYQQCAPVGNAVDLIADEIEGISPKIFDKKSKTYVDNHPIYEILNHPFGDITWSEFVKSFAIFYLVTGNNYTLLTGDVRQPPKEMMIIHPAMVTAIASQRDGYNEAFAINNIMTNTYSRQDINRIFHFYDQAMQGELWQSKTFNPQYNYGDGQYGMSKLAPIYFEIEQHLKSSQHNLGTLINGGSLSLIFSTDQNLTDDQYARMMQDLRNLYSGSQNARKNMILDGGLKVQDQGVSNKDMDFLELKTDAKNAIYNIFKIPLPLISNDAATYNNLEKAVLRFYDNAVLPLFRRICTQELTMLLMSRYKGSENLIITYDERDITALRERLMSHVKQMKETGIYSYNEMRAITGNDEVEGGGDILVPFNVTPLEYVGSGSEQGIPAEQSAVPKSFKFADGKDIFNYLKG